MKNIRAYLNISRELSGLITAGLFGALVLSGAYSYLKSNSKPAVSTNKNQIAYVQSKSFRPFNGNMTSIINRKTKATVLGKSTNYRPRKSPTSSSAGSPVPTPTKAPFTGLIVTQYGNITAEVQTLETLLGKKFRSVSIYKRFGGPGNMFDLADTDKAYLADRKMPVHIAWEPWNPSEKLRQSVDYLKTIPTGANDEYITSFLRSVKAYGGPVVIRFGYEMNNSSYPWANRPEEYKIAYRYVIAVAKREEVINVRWMWSVNAYAVPWKEANTISQFYPGDDVVDIIGIDGYNFGTSAPESSWLTFEQIFRPMYDYLSTAYSKPIHISETASSEMGGVKADWVMRMYLTDLPQGFPLVEQLDWFNFVAETDWRINSSPASRDAFRIYMF